VELTAERKCFLVVVPNRTADTLTTIIHRFVRPGSTIYTDCWAGYSNLESLGYAHRTVNHSQTFRDGDVCTNTIEGNGFIYIDYSTILTINILKIDF
jgi:transposase-like protein